MVNRFKKLDEVRADLIQNLFEVSPPEHPELKGILQDWGRGDVELTDEQVRFTRDAIRRYAIPRWQRVVAKRGETREDARKTLAQWESLAALLSGALQS